MARLWALVDGDLHLFVDGRQGFGEESPGLVALALFPLGHRQQQSQVVDIVVAGPGSFGYAAMDFSSCSAACSY